MFICDMCMNMKDFCELVDEVVMLMVYEIIRDVELEIIDV